MKALPTALATHLARGTTTLAHLLKITRTDAQVFAFTSADADVILAGVLYRSTPGLDVSSVVTAAGLAVDNLELSTLDDGSTFLKADVLGGRWRNAAFTLARYNWASPSDGIDTLMAGTVGEVRLLRGAIVAELRGLQQYLQQPVGAVTSKNCRARLGDALCTLALGGFTVSGTVTSVASNQVFTDAAQAQATDWFTEGVLSFTSGLNSGLAQKVKGFASGGVFTLSLPMIQAVAVGDTFTVVAGCQKRLAEDCLGKFNNVLNFQGEPHLPGIDALVKAPL